MKISEIVNNGYDDNGGAFENLVEDKAKKPVDWPTNLAWRIQLKRFKNVEVLSDLRKGKLFAMPFKNWVGTYWNLLGKDVKKIPYMPTQVLEISDSTMVADMELIDNVFYFNGGSGKAMTDAGRLHLEKYEATAVSYADFKRDPYIFSRPEILIEPNEVKFLQMKVVTTAELDPDEAIPTPLLGIKETK